MVVASPPALPDEVFLSGSMNYNELQVFGGPGQLQRTCGGPVRQCRGQLHRHDQRRQDVANGLHPDHHSLLFVSTLSWGRDLLHCLRRWGRPSQRAVRRPQRPDCSTRPATGLDLLSTARCSSPAIPTNNNSNTNIGLQTLQFQSASVGKQRRRAGLAPRTTAPGRATGQSGFAETVGGDGGQSDVQTPPTPAIRVCTPTSTPSTMSASTAAHPTSWDWVSDPFNEAVVVLQHRSRRTRSPPAPSSTGCNTSGGPRTTVAPRPTLTCTATSSPATSACSVVTG